MRKKMVQKILLKAACLALVSVGPVEMVGALQTLAPTQGASQAASPDAAPMPPAAAPMTTDQLNSLVAPIALYPDALVAQVLGAATFPDQVAFADDWLAQNKALTGAALTQAVDQ